MKDSSWTLVTGGAKRLGAAICRELAKNGHSVVVHYNTSKSEASLLEQELKEHIERVETIQGSFSTEEGCRDFLRRYLARFSRTQCLVNNVGNYLVAPTHATNASQARELFQANVQAPLMLMQALLPSIKELQGSIVNIGTAGIHDGRADSQSGVYMASKAALWSLTKSLAKECAKDNVSINMVSPGQLTISISLEDEGRRLPMKRAGTPEEVARLVAFLLASENHYITGQIIDVAGAFGF